MNWFQKLINNPNVHIGIGATAGVAAAVFPQYAAIAGAIAGIFGATGIALPEAPRADATPPIVTTGSTGTTIAIPPAAGGGSYHKEDWINLAITAAQQAAVAQSKPRA